ncbi:uncharacterized protein GGS25DRAFT_503835, partial [Hypoxylon fragiforme]|uniref:uncharacterized protein n=1 Tax=Hypoxylon fragiforme TaxID=63214 RepID=UPI0020C72CC5
MTACIVSRKHSLSIWLVSSAPPSTTIGTHTFSGGCGWVVDGCHYSLTGWCLVRVLDLHDLMVFVALRRDLYLPNIHLAREQDMECYRGYSMYVPFITLLPWVVVVLVTYSSSSNNGGVRRSSISTSMMPSTTPPPTHVFWPSTLTESCVAVLARLIGSRSTLLWTASQPTIRKWAGKEIEELADAVWGCTQTATPMRVAVCVPANTTYTTLLVYSTYANNPSQIHGERVRRTSRCAVGCTPSHHCVAIHHHTYSTRAVYLLLCLRGSGIPDPLKDASSCWGGYSGYTTMRCTYLGRASMCGGELRHTSCVSGGGEKKASTILGPLCGRLCS